MSTSYSASFFELFKYNVFVTSELIYINGYNWVWKKKFTVDGFAINLNIFRICYFSDCYLLFCYLHGYISCETSVNEESNSWTKETSEQNEGLIDNKKRKKETIYNIW